jgi:hypothetical protein
LGFKKASVSGSQDPRESGDLFGFCLEFKKASVSGSQDPRFRGDDFAIVWGKGMELEVQ